MNNELPDASPEERLVQILPESEWETSGAYFWDWLRDENPAWSKMEYRWIACSRYGDQIIIATHSPLHAGEALYMFGPDLMGPNSKDRNWPDNLLYLGASFQEWLDRIERFGDEYAVVCGCFDNMSDSCRAFREIYKNLNPGLRWPIVFD